MSQGAQFRRAWTALRSGLRGVRTAPGVFLYSAFTTTAGLLLLGGYLLVLDNMRETVARFGDDFSLVAFFATGSDPDPDLVKRLTGTLSELEEVEQVVFVSREEAMARLASDLGEAAAVLAGLSSNPLPASLELEVRPEFRNRNGIQRLARRVEQSPGIAETRFGEDWVRGYERAIAGLEVAGLVIGSALLLILAIIVAGTVRLAVYARADEIEIQRLVGAGGLYVRMPFYIQGSLCGFLGGALSLGILYLVYLFDFPALGAPLAFLTGGRDPSFFGVSEVVFVMVVGISLGLAGAIFSLFRLEEAS